jgi:hypothetical protein
MFSFRQRDNGWQVHHSRLLDRLESRATLSIQRPSKPLVAK